MDKKGGQNYSEMSTTVTLRLIFVNFDGKPVEVTVPVCSCQPHCFPHNQTSWNFKELKKFIVTDHWPANYIETSNIERLRLFSCGKELEDPKFVSGMLLQAPPCTNVF